MYAAIHPDGLVVFRRPKVIQVGEPPFRNESNTKAVPSNSSDQPSVRAPPGIVLPIDPWWIHLTDSQPENDTNATNLGENGDRPLTPVVDWQSRVRVKIANVSSTTQAPTLKPRSRPTSLIRPRPPKPTVAEDYDENTITYNYKSYDTFGVRTRP